MRKYWKRLGAWVTALKADPFARARLKFSVIFAAVIAVILVSYLPLLYIEFNRSIQEFAVKEIPQKDSRTRFISRSTKVTATTLFGIQPEDILILVAGAVVSYFLAGFVLKPIKESMRQREQFVASASHELKTPLSIIKTEMEVFLRGKNYVKSGQDLLLRRKASILSNLEEVNRMDQIIKNLLLVARIDASYERLRLSEIELNHLISNVAKRFQNMAKHNGLKLSINLSRPIYMMADAEKLEEAFSNIMQNAVNYSKKGGSIKIETKKMKNAAFVSFEDKGIGIPNGDLPRIFDRFYRVKSSSSKIPGSGIGLWIAKQVISMHKGKIEASSVLGKGTKISIILPLSRTS